MSSAQKTLYGIMAFMPILLSIVLIVQIFSMIGEIIPTSRFEEPNPRVIFETVFPIVMWGVFAGLLSLASVILYIVHAVNNKSLESGERTMWILLFIFVNGISQPIYFLLRIVNAKPKDDGISKM